MMSQVFAKVRIRVIEINIVKYFLPQSKFTIRRTN